MLSLHGTQEFGTSAKWALDLSQRRGHEVQERGDTGRSEWVQWLYGDWQAHGQNHLLLRSLRLSQSILQETSISILKLGKLCRKSDGKSSFTKSYVTFSPGARGREVQNKTSRPPGNIRDLFSMWMCSRSLRWLWWVLICYLWNRSNVIFKKGYSTFIFG